MKKYKLIKEYPGSPKLGSIIEKTGVGHGLIYELKLHPGKCQVFTKCEIENYPKFWEEVVEKNYEVLSITGKTDNTMIYYKEGDIFKTTKGGFVIRTFPEGNHGCQIYSVKRLSDGEIFTIGDKIKYQNSYVFPKEGCESCPIEKFNIYKNEIYVNSHYYTHIDCKIKDWVKDVKPLFTTEDGVDMFKGDIYFRVMDFKILAFELKERFSNSYIGAKFFSTREAAEEYILINKPYLSVSDIEKNIFNIVGDDYYNQIKKNLIKLVKSKL